MISRRSCRRLQGLFPDKRLKRGRPKVYPDVLIIKGLVSMIIRRLYSEYNLLAFLKQDTALTNRLVAQLETRCVS